MHQEPTRRSQLFDVISANEPLAGAEYGAIDCGYSVIGYVRQVAGVLNSIKACWGSSSGPRG
jgi:hypothetical protein